MSTSRFSTLVGIMALAVACAPRAVPVPELDSTTLDESAVHPTSDAMQVRAVLGSPPFTAELIAGSETWWYPVRVTAGRLGRSAIPAAMLRVWLDSERRVMDWSFVHPVSGARLAIRETLAEADAWRSRICNPPARIELAGALGKGVAKEEVLDRLRWYSDLPRPPTILERTFVRVDTHGDREVLTFYADRPSPLYIPPFHLEVTFYYSVKLPTTTVIQGWGGCK